MSIRAAIAALLLAAAAPAFGQDRPRLTMKVGDMTVVADDSMVTVDVAPNALQKFELTGPSRLQFKPGLVQITYPASPSPTPTPTPSPDPPPAPPPPTPVPAYTGMLWVTIVYDDATDTQDAAAARTDLTSAQTQAELAAAPLNATVRAFDKDSDTVKRQGLDKHFASTPTILIQEQKPGATSAPVVKTIPGQASKADVLATLKAMRGLPK